MLIPAGMWATNSISVFVGIAALWLWTSFCLHSFSLSLSPFVCLLASLIPALSYVFVFLRPRKTYSWSQLVRWMALVSESDQTNILWLNPLLLKRWCPIRETLMIDLEYIIRPWAVKGEVYAGMFRKTANICYKKKWGKCSYLFNTLWVEQERTERPLDIPEMCPGNLANKMFCYCKFVEWPLMRIKMLHIALIQCFSFLPD